MYCIPLYYLLLPNVPKVLSSRCLGTLPVLLLPYHIRLFPTVCCSRNSTNPQEFCPQNANISREVFYKQPILESVLLARGLKLGQEQLTSFMDDNHCNSQETLTGLKAWDGHLASHHVCSVGAKTHVEHWMLPITYTVAMKGRKNMTSTIMITVLVHERAF